MPDILRIPVPLNSYLSTHKGVNQMSTSYTEADYEKSVMELFEGLGYTRLYGPEVERDIHSPLYDAVLTAAQSLSS